LVQIVQHNYVFVQIRVTLPYEKSGYCQRLF
jgi:hypothetical protein